MVVYIDKRHLKECEDDLDLGIGRGCRVVLYPHRIDLSNLTKFVEIEKVEEVFCEKCQKQKKFKAWCGCTEPALEKR